MLTTRWYCGAFSPPMPLLPYRCTRRWGHLGLHWAVIDGVKVATWPRLAEKRSSVE